MVLIDLDVRCSECGDTLAAEVAYSYQFKVRILVKPCSRCLEKANEEGFDQGLREGESGRAV